MIVIIGFIFNVLIWQYKLGNPVLIYLPPNYFEMFLACEMFESGSCGDSCYISALEGREWEKVTLSQAESLGSRSDSSH